MQTCAGTSCVHFHETVRKRRFREVTTLPAATELEKVEPGLELKLTEPVSFILV